MQSNAAEKLNTELLRGPHQYQAHPVPEAIWIHGKVHPPCTLSIVADGKNVFYSLSRKQLLGLAAQIYEALKVMEPGK